MGKDLKGNKIDVEPMVSWYSVCRLSAKATWKSTPSFEHQLMKDRWELKAAWVWMPAELLRASHPNSFNSVSLIKLGDYILCKAHKTPRAVSSMYKTPSKWYLIIFYHKLESRVPFLSRVYINEAYPCFSFYHRYVRFQPPCHSMCESYKCPLCEIAWKGFDLG